MTSALITIDFINDSIHPDSPSGQSERLVSENNVLQHANTALAHARANDWLVVLVKVGFEAGYAACPAHSPLFGGAQANSVLQLGTWGTQFHDALDSRPVNPARELTLVKPRVSAFYGTQLDAALRANAIDTVFLCGVSTTWAVQSSVRDAHDRDYRVHVIEDACADRTLEEHEASLQQLARISGMVQSHQLPKAEKAGS